MKTHGIHVSLNYQQALQARACAARFVEPVELPALVKQHRLGRVEVLRLPLVDDPAAEGNDPSSDVADGKHQSVAKAVVVALALARLPALALDDQTQVRERLAVGLVSAEALQDLVPTVRGIADAEFLQRRPVQSTLERVGLRSLIPQQGVRIELRYPRHQVVQRLVGAFRSGGSRTALVRHLE